MMVVLRNEPNLNPLRCYFRQSTSKSERERDSEGTETSAVR